MTPPSMFEPGRITDPSPNYGAFYNYVGSDNDTVAQNYLSFKDCVYVDLYVFTNFQFAPNVDPRRITQCHASGQ
jgi:hypothetical protein